MHLKDTSTTFDSSPSVDQFQAQQRYGEERAKRLRDDGNQQFIDLSLSDEFRHFQDDPWVDDEPIQEVEDAFPASCCRVMVLGAGFGGLQYAINILEESNGSIKADDLRIVDSAGGFGGTWYWNRFPGLNCDIESYVYLPRLEDTGYMPRHRYSSGEEIREYANLLAHKWDLHKSAVFRTKATKLEWDEKTEEWQVDLHQQRRNQEEQHMTIRCQFVALANGVLNSPKLPKIPGLLNFRGSMFHSSRWDYAATGGSPASPSMENLHDKRVAIIGTGASAVSVVPELAKWAKHLYVIQRTPASVGKLEQRRTDPHFWETEVATGPGWQRERMRNFHEQMTTGEKPKTNLIDDHWTRAEGMVAVSGNPVGPKSMEELPAYLKQLSSLDLIRQNALQKRVHEVVEDPQTGRSLEAWYPTWCKRPCHSDGYLEAFNRDNVTLVDTHGKGAERLTADSIVAAGTDVAVDVIVFATGYRAPFIGSPANKANATIIGRSGISMTEERAKSGPSTLHGAIDHNFPNLFLSGPWQSSLSPNNLFNLGAVSRQGANILATSIQKAQTKSFAISLSAEGAQNWGMGILMHSPPMAALAGCLPSYFNVEGELDRLPPEEQMKVARSGLWGHGIEDYLDQVEKWRAGDGYDKDIKVEA